MTIMSLNTDKLNASTMWATQLDGLEQSVEKLRESAYRDKRFFLSSGLQQIRRDIHRLRSEEQTRNKK